VIVPLKWCEETIRLAALHVRNGKGGMVDCESIGKNPEAGSSKSVPSTCPTRGLGCTHDDGFLMAPGTSKVPQSPQLAVIPPFAMSSSSSQKGRVGQVVENI